MSGFLKTIRNKVTGKGTTKPIKYQNKNKIEVAWKDMVDKLGCEVRNGYDRDEGILVYIKLTNLTDTLWGNLQITMNMTGRKVVRPGESTYKSGMLEGGENTIMKFKFTPLYHPGLVKLYPIFSFFDFGLKKTIEVQLEGKQIDISMPALSDKKFKMTEIFDVDWKVIVSSMEDMEKHTMDIPEKPSLIFKELRESIMRLGIHGFKPEISPHIYRAIGRFWCEGLAGEKYGIHLEVIGRESGVQDDIKSRALLIFYSSEHMNITSFASGIMHHIKTHSEYGKYFQVE